MRSANTKTARKIVESRYRSALEGLTASPDLSPEERSLAVASARPVLPKVDGSAVKARLSRSNRTGTGTEGEGIVVEIPYAGDRQILENILPSKREARKYGSISVRHDRLTVFHHHVVSTPNSDPAAFDAAKATVADRTRRLVATMAAASSALEPFVDKSQSDFEKAVGDFEASLRARKEHPRVVDRFEAELASMDFGL